jgi:hypothetical protein
MQRQQHGEGKRSRILADDEITALWSVAPELGAFGAVCQTLLVTNWVNPRPRACGCYEQGIPQAFENVHHLLSASIRHSL